VVGQTARSSSPRATSGVVTVRHGPPTPIYVRKRKRPREPSRAPGAIVCLLSAHSFVLLSPDPIGPPREDADYRVVAVKQRYSTRPARRPCGRLPPAPRGP